MDENDPLLALSSKLEEMEEFIENAFAQSYGKLDLNIQPASPEIKASPSFYTNLMAFLRGTGR